MKSLVANGELPLAAATIAGVPRETAMEIFSVDECGNHVDNIIHDDDDPIDLTLATPLLLIKAVRAAQRSTDPKVIIPVLDALLKRGHKQDDESKVHDIREIMKILTPQQLDFLKAKAGGKPR